MSASGRDEPLTSYLMYKASLQSEDVELGKGPYIVRTFWHTDRDSCGVPGLHMSELRERRDLALRLCNGGTKHRKQEASH
jgi:hypothetical protein